MEHGIDKNHFCWNSNALQLKMSFTNTRDQTVPSARETTNQISPTQTTHSDQRLLLLSDAQHVNKSIKCRHQARKSAVDIIIIGISVT